MPTPASQPELQRLASPVPRYSVFPDESFGSATRLPTEFWSRPPFSHVHAGSAARASSVRQTPPPDVPTQTRQFPGTQVEATSRAVVRLAVLLVAPENARTPGWVALTSGP